MFGGGYPIKVDGHIIGALGVSGGKVPEDEKVAAAALAVIDG
ncbi:MAG: heme-binding protein [Coxiellaceae bacterium]|nr:heme-binding protein [Coxiellaceae bacterium]